MHKYPKLLRIPYDHVMVSKGKRYHPKPKTFFKGKIELSVTEKVDGSLVGVGYKGGMPYLQGKNTHIPQGDKRKAYYGIWSWAWKNLEKIQNLKGYIIFGEWMRVQHNLPYDHLPDWFIGFDVYEIKTKRFFDINSAHDFMEDIGFSHVPIIYEGKVAYEELPDLVQGQKSFFATTTDLFDMRFGEDEIKQIKHANSGERFEDNKIYMEGCVIKPYHNPKYQIDKKTMWWQNCAKFVSQEFLDEFEEDCHWTSHRMRENKLMEWKK